MTAGGISTPRVASLQGEGQDLLPGATWHQDPYAAAEGAHLVVILTEWNEFRALDLPALAGRMHAPRMADLRNVYNAVDVATAGFEAYDAMGQDG